MTPYWVIEHETRGCFARWDRDPRTGKWRPFFHWTVTRTDTKVARFYHKAEASMELKKVKAAVPGCYLFELSGRFK